jgi:hypothetical protein
MKTYFLYVHDDRYSVPTLDTVIVRNDQRASEIAAKRLASSDHYRGVEIWEDERLVCRFDRDGSPARPEESAVSGLHFR